MASEFYAVTPIRHGVANEQGEQTEIKEFGVGDKVTGLDKKDMKALWDAGALEQREVAGSSDAKSTEDQNGNAEGPTDPPVEKNAPTE